MKLQIDYQGLVFSNYYEYQKQTFECINEDADSYGSTSNSNGNLFYPTEAQYVNSAILRNYLPYYELSCVMCSGYNNGTAPPAPPPPPPPPEAAGEYWTRWGRADCPSGSVLVYAGQGAGAVSEAVGGFCERGVLSIVMYNKGPQAGKASYPFPCLFPYFDSTTLMLARAITPCACR